MACDYAHVGESDRGCWHTVTGGRPAVARSIQTYVVDDLLLTVAVRS
jgi:hypothetical protein